MLECKPRQGGFPGGSVVKNLLAMQETRVQSLGWEDALEAGMATQSSMLAWRIPMDRGSRWATIHRVAELDTPEVTERVYMLTKAKSRGSLILRVRTGARSQRAMWPHSRVWAHR